MSRDLRTGYSMSPRSKGQAGLRPVLRSLDSIVLMEYHLSPKSTENMLFESSKFTLTQNYEHNLQDGNL